MDWAVHKSYNKDQVWVGTVDGGLWHSANGGLNFEQEMSGVGVTALAWVDGAPLVEVVFD